MKFKFDTKEKLVVFRLEEAHFGANLAADFTNTLFELPELEGRSLVLDMVDVTEITEEGAQAILAVYRNMYDNSLSCAITNLNSALTALLTSVAGEDLYLNIVPTISEAMDIVMMEEIERELNGEIE
ncbi:hypothetical protein LX64_04609 [Chitinophaga skermanii]|uniref:STAS domain-containing protein n=1 Tax=Chitinophaga skermanii TaxID=331697 RepID=A0A327Q4N7_9BACT|nr:STAS domain-containing protein [Chitinophaga skermanii]RAI99475.1 hypothetical protein LX64_04609 [Chitinophaga skermanii]